MPQWHPLRGRMLTRTVVAALVAAVVVPLAHAPVAAVAAVDDLTISGSLVAEASATHILRYYDFGVRLSSAEDESIAYKQFRGPDFSITAPEPGVYTLFISPVPTPDPSPWAGSWFGDTPFRWHASEITVSGTSPVTGLTVKIAEGGAISGAIQYPQVGLVYGLTAQAYLLDPATGRYEYIAGDSRDFAGPYSIHSLPAGSYAVRFGHSGGNSNDQTRMFPSEFYTGARYLDEAQPVELTAGGAVAGIDGELDYFSFDVKRTAGENRYATAVGISSGAFDRGVPAVYLASGAAWADALSAAPAAAHRGGPLLLTAPDHVPDVVLAELSRLQPDEIIVAGGPAVVSQTMIDTLSGRGYDVRRVAGTDRYDTSLKLAVDAFDGGPDEVSAWLATGHGFADALSAASDASRVDIPLILVDGAAGGVGESTRDTFDQLGIDHFEVAGGSAAITPAVFDALQSIPGRTASRYAGADRYETSRLIASNFISRAPSAYTGRAFLASGEGFADALAAAPIAGISGSPLFLTPGYCVPRATLDAMVELDAFLVELVGGPAVLGAGVEELAWC
ncbi:cell wall-binding repeat-containing protein [Agromyces fucosus]|uniref:Cell wall-binding repeat-containing protein n=1 Tax=Agromyces fucosus TaxID=41985 RepID=A0A4Q2JY76_9MICO|nr:cell wall-binding repeat-containing protein [Agromyces fucosus]RXZ51208.1 cell wall-binding repeat-containing protein [Agromyces fucosus]